MPIFNPILIIQGLRAYNKYAQNVVDSWSGFGFDDLWNSFAPDPTARQGVIAPIAILAVVGVVGAVATGVAQAVAEEEERQRSANSNSVRTFHSHLRID